eukprot:3519132-Amphidinium_carterae.2
MACGAARWSVEQHPVLACTRWRRSGIAGQNRGLSYMGCLLNLSPVPHNLLLWLVQGRNSRSEISLSRICCYV